MIVLQEAKDPNKVNDRLVSIIDALQRREFMVLIVEPTGKCNLKCSFCDMHNDSLDTESQKFDMSNETFEMLIDGLKKLPYKLKSIQLHGYGEPLLHKNIVHMAATLKMYCESLRVITNGTPLTLKMHTQLEAAGVDEIHISLDVADRENYLRIKKVDLYDKVMRNINALLPLYSQERGGGKNSLFIKLALPEKEYEGFWGDSSVTREGFYLSLEKLKEFTKDSKRVHLKIMRLFSTYAQQVAFQDNKPCEMPFYMLKVKSSGEIDSCCAAIFGELRVGTIKDGLDLHDNVAKIRHAHLSGSVGNSIPMCGTCSAKTAVDVSSIKDKISQLI
jgi:organic radical activating enzyme